MGTSSHLITYITSSDKPLDMSLLAIVIFTFVFSFVGSEASPLPAPAPAPAPSPNPSPDPDYLLPKLIEKPIGTILDLFKPTTAGRIGQESGGKKEEKRVSRR